MHLLLCRVLLYSDCIMQYSTVLCSTQTVLYCIMQYSTVLCSTLLYYAVLNCIMQYSTVLCSTQLYYAVLYCIMQYSTVLCSTQLYYAVLYCIMQYSTVLTVWSMCNMCFSQNDCIVCTSRPKVIFRLRTHFQGKYFQALLVCIIIPLHPECRELGRSVLQLANSLCEESLVCS